MTGAVTVDPTAIAQALALIVLLVTGVNLGRNRRKTELIALQEQQAEALRHEIADNERRCAEKVEQLSKDNAELRGRVAVLQEQQAAAIGAAIAPVVAREVVAHLTEQWGP